MSAKRYVGEMEFGERVVGKMSFRGNGHISKTACRLNGLSVKRNSAKRYVGEMEFGKTASAKWVSAKRASAKWADTVINYTQI